jgi:hypothetical protein
MNSQFLARNKKKPFYWVFTTVRMHFVHNTFRTFLPSSIKVTVCRFGRKVREVAFFDQGRFRPKVVFLPQCAHLAISLVPFQHNLNHEIFTQVRQQ